MNNHHDKYEYQTVPFPKLRRGLAMMYRAVQRAHMTCGLIEVDVTETRRYMRDHETKTAESLSFTAFIITCVAHAVDENKSLNACRKGTKRLALFDDVDIATPIERDVEGRKQPIVYIVRAANKKGVREITREIRTAQVATVETAWEGFQAERWLMLLPIFVLRGMWVIFWWVRGYYPRVRKRYGGTVGLTAVGMFGKGGGWAIPCDTDPNLSLNVLSGLPGNGYEKLTLRENSFTAPALAINGGTVYLV